MDRWRAPYPEQFVGAGPDDDTRQQLVQFGYDDDEGLVMTVYRHDFSAIGCQHTILTPNSASLAPGAELAERMVNELDRAASRFRPDSEVSRIAELAFGVDAVVVVSPLLSGCLEAALHAADITDGLVDPTVGRAVAAFGYDTDLDVVRRRPTDLGEPGRAPTSVIPGGAPCASTPVLVYSPLRAEACLISGQRRRRSQPTSSRPDLPSSCRVGSWSILAEISPSPGELPGAGWQIGVEDHHGVTRQVVVSTGQAVATSSTQLRRWTQGTEQRHHILDPRTGRTAASVWAQVSCAGTSAVEANAASTAAVILGTDAPAWLEARGIPARLDGVTGNVVVTAGWPTADSRAA